MLLLIEITIVIIFFFFGCLNQQVEKYTGQRTLDGLQTYVQNIIGDEAVPPTVTQPTGVPLLNAENFRLVFLILVGGVYFKKIKISARVYLLV